MRKLTLEASDGNLFVRQLNRYTTISSEHEAVFDEFISRADWSDGLEIKTKTENYVVRNFASQSPKSIILTGNAGDGKTYLCRRVVEEITGGPFGDWQNGERTIVLPESEQSLIVIKDLSELSEKAGKAYLQNLETTVHEASPDTVFLIAVNEGRLRALLSLGNFPHLDEEVDRQLREGTERRTKSNGLLVINLNKATTSSFVKQTVDWISKPKHWHDCGNCPAISVCPINHNVARLSSKHAIGRLELLYQIVEQLNEHATIRDMLIHLAYVVTGGLGCRKVISERNNRRWKDNVHRFVYYNNVWGIEADRIFRRKVHVLHLLQRLDVGKSSVFELDDFILNGHTSSDTAPEYTYVFTEDLDLNWKRFGQDRDAYSNASASSAGENLAIMEWLSHCRRKLFFERESTRSTNRLFPLLFATQYFQLLEEPTHGRLEHTKGRILLGLNRAFSGLFLANSDNLFVTSQYAHAIEQPVPIVQSRIPTNYIELTINEEDSESIDINRKAAELVIPPPPGSPTTESIQWSVNLLMFEYLMRKADGATSNILASECELEIRQLKERLLRQHEDDEHMNVIRFFAADNNRYRLQGLEIEKHF